MSEKHPHSLAEPDRRFRWVAGEVLDERVMLPGSRKSWSRNGGTQSTAPTPNVTSNGGEHARPLRSRSRSRHAITATTTSALIAIALSRYDTWVWAATDAATTATTAIQWSRIITDQAAVSTTSQISTGKYGFHGWVSTLSP